MQSSMVYFCEECGAANAEDATTCVACQQPLAWDEHTALPIAPVKVISTAPLQVMAGAPVVSGPLKSGTLLAGRYRILREIGQGGFGAVYQAKDLRRHSRLVAIKQINLDQLRPREVIEATDSFNREVAFLSTLNHPNLPKIYDHFTDPSHWYLVMQYIQGQTLEDCLQKSRRGYLPLQRVLKIGLAVIGVLNYLHSRRPPVIFRDLKPANIMMTRKGHVYLIDFGIARHFAPEKTKDTGPLGSPGYAAPEQYGRKQTDIRTDIYGLGATLQTLATGRDPLELRQGLAARRAKPLPEKLQTLFSEMLAADPAQRPPSVSEIEGRLTWSRWAIWNARVQPLETSKGVLTGLLFWAWYGCMVWGVTIVRHAHYTSILEMPAWARLLLVALVVFPPAILTAIAFQCAFLFFREEKQRPRATLIVLLLLLLFLLLGPLAFLFNNYPFT